MGFLGKLFGSGPDIAKLRQALEQNRYADAVHLAEDLVDAGDTSDDLAALQELALDGLARLNLEEGQRLLAVDDLTRAMEHLHLARSQAKASDLIASIEAVLTTLREGAEPHSESPAAEPVPATRSSCADCATLPAAGSETQISMPDQQIQLELILAAYPPELQQRYLAQSDQFLQAFILGHEGQDQPALDLWLQLPENEQNDLYLFELGCLYGRTGKIAEGVKLLRQALDLEQGNLLFLDSLLDLMLSQDDLQKALELLQQQLADGADPAFCHARIAALQYRLQKPDAAFTSAVHALEGGFSEPDFMVLAAELFERAGQIQEAEQLLASLPGGGCGGGINLYLAEFWLRQKRELGKVLDAFNDACRQEPDNPRWQLRVAQTYLARNWRKQGVELLQRVVGDPRLDEVLRSEAKQLLAGG